MTFTELELRATSDSGHNPDHDGYCTCGRWVYDVEHLIGVMLENREGKLAAIQAIVDKYRAGDPYHAGRVAHQLRVGAALDSMERIHQALKEDT